MIAGLGRRLPRRRAVVPSSGCVWMLHRVNPAPMDAGHYADITVTPDRLEAHLAQQVDRPRGSWQDILAGRVPDGWDLLTFDDGFGDTLEEALPILERYQMHAVVFLTVGFVGQEQEAFYAYVARILAAGGFRSVAGEVFDTDTPEGFRAAYNRAVRLVDRGSARTRWRAINALARENRSEVPETRRGIYMDWVGVRQLAQHPLITIGAHSWTHPRLGVCSPTLYRRELLAARREIERQIAQPVTLLAYPHGASNPALRLAAWAAGYRYAFSTRPACLSADEAVHRYAVPRVELT
jgi:peptidoglycan/xylan/chitin deacetylase (PgdA/CDA1 family)